MDRSRDLARTCPVDRQFFLKGIFSDRQKLLWIIFNHDFLGIITISFPYKPSPKTCMDYNYKTINIDYNRLPMCQNVKFTIQPCPKKSLLGKYLFFTTKNSKMKIFHRKFCLSKKKFYLGNCLSKRQARQVLAKPLQIDVPQPQYLLCADTVHTSAVNNTNRWRQCRWDMVLAPARKQKQTNNNTESQSTNKCTKLCKI